MYVTHRSFAAPAPAIRDFFWLCHTYSLLRGGFYNASSGFGPDPVGAKILQNLLRGASLGTLHDLYIRTTVLFGRVSQRGKKWRLQTNFHGFVY